MSGLIKYQFYATLLDAYQKYIDYRTIYNQYWGFSENPRYTEEEFEQKTWQDLINTINRVPFENEATARGTAFNEVVDCIVNNCVSEKMQIKSDRASNAISVQYKEYFFVFPLSLCLEFSRYFKGAMTQQFTDGILPTMYGDVRLYGYIDELMPLSVHDIKFTKKYYIGKFKNGYQHIVYPYCLHQNGCEIYDFEYNVASVQPTSYETFTEYYAYLPERDIPKLTAHVEDFILFLEAHRHLITDKKIFNLKEETEDGNK